MRMHLPPQCECTCLLPSLDLLRQTAAAATKAAAAVRMELVAALAAAAVRMEPAALPAALARPALRQTIAAPPQCEWSWLLPSLPQCEWSWLLPSPPQCECTCLLPSLDLLRQTVAPPRRRSNP